ncbi:porin family protein [Zunongwangia pacifica]|uniref:PorT family protein n=1 Tax=Zunongwangia pacifica TaxID=2911062 RepID=A0A9X2A0J4_9FLAO|nr:porin family protein [Zunongwangia pacifica]MCL6220220.1 PorT family protein [Zunongwangia pacifica]
MKKACLIFIMMMTSLYFPLKMSAQENIPNFSYGIKAGLNLANINSSNFPLEEFTKNRLGFHGGLVFEYRFHQFFALGAEVLYSQQGVKSESDYIEIEPPGELGINQVNNSSNESLISSTGKYDYLNIPLVAKVYFFKGLFVSAGPQLSILLSAKDEFSDSDIEVDVKEEIDNFDFGLNFGVGFQSSIGLFVSANYYLGLNNISAYNYSDELGFDPKLHQGVWQFSVGYMF